MGNKSPTRASGVEKCNFQSFFGAFVWILSLLVFVINHGLSFYFLFLKTLLGNSIPQRWVDFCKPTTQTWVICQPAGLCSERLGLFCLFCSSGRVWIFDGSMFWWLQCSYSWSLFGQACREATQHKTGERGSSKKYFKFLVTVHAGTFLISISNIKKGVSERFLLYFMFMCICICIWSWIQTGPWSWIKELMSSQ